MLHKLVNQANVKLAIEPVEPLLIASGIPNATGIDMPFVLTYRQGTDRGEPYLPGSSLKGVLRSHGERISQSVTPEQAICDPHFHKMDTSSPGRVPFCGERLKKRNIGEAFPSHDLYRKSCPICRTFGSTVYRGRLAIDDAYLKDEKFNLERRDGVGIDRFSGGSSRGVKFELEVLTRGTFHASLRLENFEDWQLGLLALLCRDLEDEFISIGHSTTRGLGRLRATLEAFDIMYVVPPGRNLDQTAVHGVGTLLSEGDRIRYGYRKDDQFPLDEEARPEVTRRGIRRVQSFAGDHDVLRQLFDDAIGCWATRMESWEVAQ